MQLFVRLSVSSFAENKQQNNIVGYRRYPLDTFPSRLRLFFSLRCTTRLVNIAVCDYTPTTPPPYRKSPSKCNSDTASEKTSHCHGCHCIAVNSTLDCRHCANVRIIYSFISPFYCYYCSCCCYYYMYYYYYYYYYFVRACIVI